MSERPESELIVWKPVDAVAIPSTATEPTEIVQYGSATLTNRDARSIVAGFNAEGYEMVATFVWTKASTTLKKQVATLGMEFVGEMLGRPDLTEDSDPTSAIADHEAIALAEDLGMITSTQGLRLKNSLTLVNHFASLDRDRGPDDEMQREEAILLLKTCISSILGKPQFEAAIRFADFRRKLGERAFQKEDGEVRAVLDSPYFFIKTTLSVLLSSIKQTAGGILENSVSNTQLFIPLFWQRLREQEKWQIGQAYAEISAEGKRLASSGLKNALLAIKGFDFVPENLRSSTYTEHAARVLSSHFAPNNFYNEREPIESLSKLGSTIPMPAFAKCMEAILAVKLGNRWGYTWTAEPFADGMLKNLTPAKWNYYVNECLPRDRVVLDKISSDEKPAQRWREVVRGFIPSEVEGKNSAITDLLRVSRNPRVHLNQIHRCSAMIRSQMED